LRFSLFPILFFFISLGLLLGLALGFARVRLRFGIGTPGASFHLGRLWRFDLGPFGLGFGFGAFLHLTWLRRIDFGPFRFRFDLRFPTDVRSHTWPVRRFNLRTNRGIHTPRLPRFRDNLGIGLGQFLRLRQFRFVTRRLRASP